MTPTTEVGVIVCAIVGMIGAFLMAMVKMFERNGAVITCGSPCCGSNCSADLRQPETRQAELKMKLAMLGPESLRKSELESLQVEEA